LSNYHPGQLISDLLSQFVRALLMRQEQAFALGDCLNQGELQTTPFPPLQPDLSHVSATFDDEVGQSIDVVHGLPDGFFQACPVAEVVQSSLPKSSNRARSVLRR